MDIGKAIRAGMDKKGIKGSKLAEMMNVRNSTVSQWLNNHSSPPGPKLLELMKILDLENSDFYEGGGLGKEKIVNEEDRLPTQEALKDVPIDYLKRLEDRLAALEKKKSLRDVDEIFREMMEGVDRQLLLSTLRCLMRLEKKEIEKFFDFTDQENFIEEFKSFLNRTRRNRSIQKKVFS